MPSFRRSDSKPLFEDNPELLKIWSSNNSKDIDKSSISKWVSKTKYLWNCDAGHEYSASPSYISNGQRCPFCAGKQVLDGFNDLACKEPGKAKFFDSESNSKTAHETLAGSAKKISWICGVGHRWQQAPFQFKFESGCPVCKKRLIVQGQNDLATTHPELASQYSRSNSKPATQIGSNSTKKVKWVCELGHEWSAVVRERESGKGCPVCSNNKIVAGVNDFGSEHPELVAEWDFDSNEKEPSEVASGSGYRASWVCGLGHKWVTPVYRRSNGRGCVFCANREVWKGYNDLESRFPGVASEWDKEKNDLSPSEVLYGSHQKAFFRCPNGHSYESKIESRTLNGSQCTVCLGFKVVAGVNDLLSQRPRLAARWSSRNSVSPDKVYMNAMAKKYIFECEIGHEYLVAPQNASDEYCPTCSNKEFETGFNDLRTHNKELADEFVSCGKLTDPSLVPYWLNKKAQWRCQRGHTWSAAVRDRALGNDCPFCSNKRVWKGYNDLAEMYPDIAKQWDQKRNLKKATEVMAHTPQKHWWICERGHSYEQSVRNKTVLGHKCPVCSNRKLLVGFNDLNSRYPELAREWHQSKNNFSPKDVVFGHPDNLWWQCSEGHEWQAAPSTRIKGIGCQSCNHGGFNPSAPANLYFLVNKELGARKVGIRGLDSSRLRNFELIGWSCIIEYGFDEGTKARQVEKNFFMWLRREVGLPSFLGKEEMEPFGGATETFSAEGPSDYEIQEKISQLIESGQ